MIGLKKKRNVSIHDKNEIFIIILFACKLISQEINMVIKQTGSRNINS